MFIEYNGKTPRVHPTAFVAPTAVLIGDVEVGESASIWFGAVIRGDNGLDPHRRAQQRAGQCRPARLRRQPHADRRGRDDRPLRNDGRLHDRRRRAHRNECRRAQRRDGRPPLADRSGQRRREPTRTFPPGVLAAGAPAVVKRKLEGNAFEWVDHGGPEYVAAFPRLPADRHRRSGHPRSRRSRLAAYRSGRTCGQRSGEMAAVAVRNEQRVLFEEAQLDGPGRPVARFCDDELGQVRIRRALGIVIRVAIQETTRDRLPVRSLRNRASPKASGACRCATRRRG